jgi:hypothetical protein
MIERKLVTDNPRSIVVHFNATQEAISKHAQIASKCSAADCTIFRLIANRNQRDKDTAL